MLQKGLIPWSDLQLCDHRCGQSLLPTFTFLGKMVEALPELAVLLLAQYGEKPPVSLYCPVVPVRGEVVSGVMGAGDTGRWWWRWRLQALLLIVCTVRWWPVTQQCAVEPFTVNKSPSPHPSTYGPIPCLSSPSLFSWQTNLFFFTFPMSGSLSAPHRRPLLLFLSPSPICYIWTRVSVSLLLPAHPPARPASLALLFSPSSSVSLSCFHAFYCSSPSLSCSSISLPLSPSFSTSFSYSLPHSLTVSP